MISGKTVQNASMRHTG